jgi:hypothetical protein
VTLFFAQAVSESLHLLFSEAKGCISNDTWTTMPDYIQTVSVNDDNVFLIVSLDVGGFQALQSGEVSSNVANAQITFLFDTECSADCEFLFFLVRHELSTVWFSNFSAVCFFCSLEGTKTDTCKRRQSA